MCVVRVIKCSAVFIGTSVVRTVGQVDILLTNFVFDTYGYSVRNTIPVTVVQKKTKQYLSLNFRVLTWFTIDLLRLSSSIFS